MHDRATIKRWIFKALLKLARESDRLSPAGRALDIAEDLFRSPHVMRVQGTTSSSWEADLSDKGK